MAGGMKNFRRAFAETARSFVEDDSAATLIEYCLIASMFALVILIAVTELGKRTSDMYMLVSDAILAAVT